MRSVLGCQKVSAAPKMSKRRGDKTQNQHWSSRGSNTPDSSLCQLSARHRTHRHSRPEITMIAASSDPTGLGQIRLSGSICLECLQRLYHVETYGVYFMLRLSWFLSIRASMINWCCVWWLSYSFKGRRQEEDETMHVQIHFIKKILYFLMFSHYVLL